MELALSGGILSMDEPAGISLLRPADHGDMIAAMAAFIAGGPHEDGGVVFKLLHHPLHALNELLFPIRHGTGPGIGVHIIVIGHIGKPAQEAMGFDIRFADHIQSDLIAQLQKYWCRRIMRSTDAVDVELLHQF